MPKNPLSNWYGYDKKFTKPVTSFLEADFANQRSYYRSDRKISMGQVAYDYIMTQKSSYDYRLTDRNTEDNRTKLLRLYFPPADGLADEDFIKFIDGMKLDDDGTSNYYNWRTRQALDASGINYGKGSNNYSLCSVFYSFFDTSNTRTDRIFRLIEINEFLNIDESDKSTFEEFLASNKTVEEKCKNLQLITYSTPLETLISYTLPDFLQFGSRITLKTKSLLLSLTREQMQKVFDVDSNPYGRANSSNSHSFEFAQIYIAAAIGEAEVTPVKELTDSEISNALTLALMSKTEYWNKVSLSRRCSGLVSEVLEEMSKVSFNVDTFKRNFAYLIAADVLKDLSAKELVAVVYGYEKSHRWAEQSKGKSTQELLMELMQSGKLNPLAGAKMIAHIVSNHLQPIVLDPDQDWEVLNDTIPGWSYELLTHSTKTRTIGKPPLVSAMSKY